LWIQVGGPGYETPLRGWKSSHGLRVVVSHGSG
jgi:hypothetical protein